jgi:hypothetical protein
MEGGEGIISWISRVGVVPACCWFGSGVVILTALLVGVYAALPPDYLPECLRTYRFNREKQFTLGMFGVDVDWPAAGSVDRHLFASRIPQAVGLHTAPSRPELFRDRQNYPPQSPLVGCREFSPARYGRFREPAEQRRTGKT